MTPWSARQVLTLLLAVLVSLSMSLSAIQASTMIGSMADMTPAMTKMMGGSGHDTCKDCTKGGEGGAKAIACGSVWVAPVIAALPQALLPVPLAASVVSIKQYSLLHGRVPAPDPYPPRPKALD